MDLVEILSKEVKDKNLTDFEMVRYIYLRCCEIFSFDVRWNYSQFYDELLIRQIETKQFNVRNIDSTLVVCHSFSSSIIIPLIEEFTNCKVILNKGSHSYVELYEGETCWRLDATKGDMPRVKLGLMPYGMHLEEGINDLGSIDIKLGYRFNRSQVYTNKVRGTFTEKMMTIGEILRDSKCKYHLTDALFLYNMLSIEIPQDGKVYMDDNGQLYRHIKFPMFDNQEYMIAKNNDEYQLTKLK